MAHAVSRRAFNAALTALGMSASGLALAQTPWMPNKPVRILVPFSAGALTDIIARIYAEKLTQSLGQSVIVENKPGAGGVSASQLLLSLPADGHAMLFVSSAHAANPALKLKLPYDTEKDFSGLALLASSPSLVVVRENHPAKTLGEFVAAAKKDPGAMTYGSAGVGSATHLTGAYFAAEEKVNLLHVPYKGVQEAVNEVMAGRLDTAFPPIALAQSFIKSGRIRALAVTSPERSPSMPDVPTVAELGTPGFESSIWYALVMSSATPKPVMESLAAQMVKVTEMPDVADKLKSQGLIASKLTLGDFDKMISADIKKTAKLVKASGIQPE
ncbi:MAG: tripartite tricarboxylate transporter substrate binding protein [Gammaproteobacteria bacterium]|nr:tripartite tricarboxylate transporter substrate binding protein [Gammaproteobacteria bacterium]MBU1444370.1 tripartite tricarboxylate transporter substrate binding protein [Gammaproteobacteria bacterium]MBU2285905.1 tripartite tricarboxylate transporter substrate binding protein [Gammaproteobacteria bacterium]MBU2409343.1 tripartite tricarboxylate transporter substrate binding protein [Gammaproteobacteria bacterium]